MDDQCPMEIRCTEEGPGPGIFRAELGDQQQPSKSQGKDRMGSAKNAFPPSLIPFLGQYEDVGHLILYPPLAVSCFRTEWDLVGLQRPEPGSVPWGQAPVRTSRVSKACWQEETTQTALCFLHSLSVPALVLPATWLCNTGSPGAAGWSRCWFLALRSVLGPSV